MTNMVKNDKLKYIGKRIEYRKSSVIANPGNVSFFLKTEEK
jgi:hypothetical protein